LIRFCDAIKRERVKEKSRKRKVKLGWGRERKIKTPISLGRKQNLSLKQISVFFFFKRSTHVTAFTVPLPFKLSVKPFCRAAFAAFAPEGKTLQSRQ
jgi:hypothetical protein